MNAVQAQDASRFASKTFNLSLLCFGFSVIYAGVSAWGLQNGSTCDDFFWTITQPDKYYIEPLLPLIVFSILASGLFCLIAGLAALYKIARAKNITNLLRTFSAMVLAVFSVLAMPWLAQLFLIPGNYQSELEGMKESAQEIYKSQIMFQHKKGRFLQTCDELERYIGNAPFTYYLSPDKFCYYEENKNWASPLPPGFNPFVGNKEFLIAVVEEAGCKRRSEVFTVNEKGNIKRATKASTWKKLFSARIDDAHESIRGFAPIFLLGPYAVLWPFY